MQSPTFLFIFIAHLITRCTCEHEDLFQFFTSGVRRIYFEQLNNVHVNVSQQCKQVMTSLNESVFSGEKWSNAMLDATASTPVSLYKGTVTNLGAFDSCLSSEKATHYCLIESRPSRQLSLSSASLRLRHELPVLDRFYIMSGVCMPRECSENDVKIIWSTWLPLYSFELINQDKLTCSHEPEKRSSSYFSFYALSAFVVFQILVGIKNILLPGDRLIDTTFSPLLHLRELFQQSKREATTVDAAKVFMIIMGISAHCLLCLEKLHAISILGKFCDT